MSTVLPNLIVSIYYRFRRDILPDDKNTLTKYHNSFPMYTLFGVYIVFYSTSTISEYYKGFKPFPGLNP